MASWRAFRPKACNYPPMASNPAVGQRPEQGKDCHRGRSHLRTVQGRRRSLDNGWLLLAHATLAQPQKPSRPTKSDPLCSCPRRSYARVRVVYCQRPFLFPPKSELIIWHDADRRCAVTAPCRHVSALGRHTNPATVTGEARSSRLAATQRCNKKPGFLAPGFCVLDRCPLCQYGLRTTAAPLGPAQPALYGPAAQFTGR